MKINWEFVKALVYRDLRRYFSNPNGYVFITLFIFMSAAAAFWQDRFFLNNLASLEQLNNLFPYLLLFFVPALTMSVWAEERRQATDELLFTMPATSLEVVLGKYISTLGIYTVSLLLSLSHVLVLFWLGSPDLGLMFGNYVGYWFIGGALISLGMLASLLTPNAAIAYILGAVLCSIFVFTESIFGIFGVTVGGWLGSLSVIGHLDDFARGVVSLSGVFYFSSVAGILLYLNVLTLDRRHWPRELEGRPTWMHQVARALAVIVCVISLNAVFARTGIRLDVTAERLHSLSGETKNLVGELDANRPVFIQAFVSPEVPEPFVQTRSDLLDTLKGIDSAAGSAVVVRIQVTEPFSPQASEAREKFGITPRPIPNLGSARAGVSEVFLGVAITCGAEEQVIPFMDRGLSAEYEIARSIRVVARTSRAKVGVLETGINIFGGLDFQTMRNSPSWSVVGELRKQYDVVQISSPAEMPDDLDGLLVALPSSLPQPEMDQLYQAIESGVPTLLLVDPLPVVDIGLAPSEQAGGNRNPMMGNQGPPPQPKGDIQAMMTRLGISWDSARIIWDSYNPHPDLANLPPEVVFVGRGNENEAAFNPGHNATSGLQETVLLYPGELNKAMDSKLVFEPLLMTGRVSGRFAFPQMVQRSFFGVQMNRNLQHIPDDLEYTLAAHVWAPGGEANNGDDAGSGEGAEEASSGARKPVNVIVTADLDFISEQFFQIRAVGVENLKFDNIPFFLNCMDILVGDESFIALRNKRIKHRTLERVEEQTRNFIEQRVEDEQLAESEAEIALADAQRRLDEKVNEVQQRPDLDAQTKQIMARNLQEAESRRFEVLKANIEAEKEAKIHASKENMEAQIRGIQNTIRTFAVLLPPIPVFILGVFIFVKRQRREREGAAAARRLRA